MHYLALATDYDGTVADDRVVDKPTIAALERLLKRRSTKDLQEIVHGVKTASSSLFQRLSTATCGIL